MALTQAPAELLNLDSGITISTADNLTQLTLTSTDADASPGPQLDMVRDSASPADSDVLGRIRFRGDNDAGEVTTMVYLQTYLHDASDGTEDGGLDLFARQGGTLNRRITINSSGEICFNEDSADIDFRVESNGNANMFFVDGGNNRVGIGTNSPTQVLDVQGTALMERSRLSTNDGTTYWDFRRDSSTGHLVISDDGLGDHITVNQTNGNVTLADGNFIFASGHGIDFANSGGSSATNASTGSHLLDDYEEGTWTPTINSGTVSASQATYTKIGNLVTIRANLADISDHTTASDIIISGIPFSAGSTNRGVGSVLFRRFSKGNASHMVSYTGQNGTGVYFYWSFNADSLWTAVHFEDGTQANMDIIFTLSYIV